MAMYHGAVCLLYLIARFGTISDAFSVPTATSNALLPQSSSLLPWTTTTTRTSLISLRSSSSPSSSSGNSGDDGASSVGVTNSKARPSLADMEDMEEERLRRIEDHRKNLNKSSSHSIKSSASSSGTDALYNGMFEEEDAENAKRQQKIQEILEEDDAKWKEERRIKMLGKFANVKDEDEWKQLEDEERQQIHKENERKTEIAKASGVTLTMLEAEEDVSSPQPSESSSLFEQPKITGRKPASWFQDIDNQLNKEIPQLGSSDSSSRIVNGKLVTTEQQQGIQVGSAGGWNLEVFPGDFVVHRKYGIGRYEGSLLKLKRKLTEQEITDQTERRDEIVKEMLRLKNNNITQIEAVIANFGSENDVDPISNPVQTVLEITYADATVHVPIDKAYRLSRYRAGDSAVKPRLSRCKGEAWRKAKNRVEEDTIQMAEDVLALYATRETLQRSPYDPTKEVHVRDFEKTFPYEPTPDQITCFEATENDMVWRRRPMDRLVCGDVGFGKTEVALRALFRCVANGRQAALLSPTGVLAAQHFKNVQQRMGDESNFNTTVALLRGGMGMNTKAGRELRERISSGEVQLVVGTHALLSRNLEFKDLGLLVVDEEQRFGVKQKERLKLICNGVDVLTLSATPIPRTLQMSLSGIRDTSTIRSPPPMRLPTMTYVQEFSEELVRDAINREMARGGQCYFVVPRISQLEESEKVINKLFPELRTIQAHGRMSRGVAENNVAAFAEGNHDILLATTVIENGVDIPSVNTIIIQNAQAFGMSTLYQLRGRVGRSNLQAYAYFLHKEDAITEASAMRLKAMADLHELGSGFDVANRDLEIRGAGSLLGTEQSGMAAKVGFDLYMRMLKKSMRQLRGLDLPMVPRTNIILPSNEGSLEILEGPGGEVAHAFEISTNYIADPIDRSKQEGVARLADSTTQLVNLTNTWKKNYGPLPPQLQDNLKTLHLHACTRILGIDLIGLRDRGNGKMDCVLRSPGLRPRHWAYICQSLPKGMPTKGLDVIFPSRISMTEADFEIKGGKVIDLEALVEENNKYGDDEEEWDALDQEEVEAMKEISSAMNVKSLDEIDVEEYPRFVVRNLGKLKEGTRVGALLKLLLPASKVVYEKQEADKSKAMVAAELREKQELMKKQKKEQEKMNTIRMGYLP